jgi:hypothetical protein
MEGATSTVFGQVKIKDMETTALTNTVSG